MQTRESALRDILRLFIWYPFRRAVQLMPPGCAFSAFKLLGDLHYFGAGRSGGNLRANITGNLGAHRDVNPIIRKYYQLHYLDRLHIFLYPRFTKFTDIAAYVYFANREVLDKEVANGKGVLLVQPHFGPVQITLLALALSGYEPVQIGYPKDEGLSRIGRSVAFRYRLAYEAMLPAPIFPADQYLGAVFRHLKKGGVVLTTGDGAGGGVHLGEHIQLDFFNTRRLFPTGPARWSVKTGAAYVPAFIIPESPSRFRVEFAAPLRSLSDDPGKAVRDITARYVDVIQRYIKAYPSCWHFWDDL